MNAVMKELSAIEDLRNIENAFDDEEPYINLEILQEKTLFTKGPRNFSLVFPGRSWLFAGNLSKIEGKHYIEYWAILLSDCLILARRTEQRVLLILEEPVLLRSIYQATFDVKKCDSEFRILFAAENPHKSAGQRNQWITWILRAPSFGIKLLWQTIITNQLSLHSTEALNQGKKPSFVHIKPPLGLKSLLPKTNLRHSESSFATTQSQLSMPASFQRNQFYSVEIYKNTMRGNPSLKSRLREKEISFKLEKETSQISLDDGKPEEKVLAVRRASISRSKSFGNDIKEAIPYIDCVEENNSGTESNIDSVQNITPAMKIEGSSEIFESDSSLKVMSGSPERMDRFVQTEVGSSYSSSPRSQKRFPRLGTFERIKLENKSATLPIKNFPRTRIGTSSKHRRPITTTVSKEQLIKAETVSPIMDQKCSEPRSITPILQKRNRKGFFSRLWKKESKPYSGINCKNDEEKTKKETLSLNDYTSAYSENKDVESPEKLNFELLVSTPNSSQVSV
nr:uncharacterized protein LOC122271557 [Parasteatoda tepidariorum]